MFVDDENRTFYRMAMQNLDNSIGINYICCPSGFASRLMCRSGCPGEPSFLAKDSHKPSSRDDWSSLKRPSRRFMFRLNARGGDVCPSCRVAFLAFSLTGDC
jgi:hypothetical protein